MEISVRLKKSYGLADVYVSTGSATLNDTVELHSEESEQIAEQMREGWLDLSGSEIVSKLGYILNLLESENPLSEERKEDAIEILSRSLNDLGE